MKKIVAIAVAALFAFALVGCGKSVPNAARYEARITALESNVTELYQRNENRKADFTNVFAIQEAMAIASSNQMNFNMGMFAQDTNQQVQLDLQLLLIEDLQARLTNRAPVRAPVYRAPVVYQQVGPTPMPASVAAGIRADAERRYPNDYSMQANVIKWQSEDWHKLHP